MEDRLYEVESVRRLTGIRLRKVPDETTILNLRRLLGRHGLGKVLFASSKEHLAEQGPRRREGTILDASILAAPSPTKNSKGERDGEMEQPGKGKQWRFGMRLPIGVDDQTGLVHSLATSAANVHDLRPRTSCFTGKKSVSGVMDRVGLRTPLPSGSSGGLAQCPASRPA